MKMMTSEKLHRNFKRQTNKNRILILGAPKGGTSSFLKVTVSRKTSSEGFGIQHLGPF